MGRTPLRTGTAGTAPGAGVSWPPRRRRHPGPVGLVVVVAVAALGVLLTSCGAPDDPARSTGPNPAPEAAGSSSLAPGRLTVLAAASLSDAFEAIAADFEAAHPDVEVTVSFAASSTLAAQVREGAPADVLATADTAAMDTAAGSGSVAGAPTVVAGNGLAIAVAPGNPLGVTGLADLARSDLVVVGAAPAVPISRYARTALTAAGVDVRPVSEEADVRAVLSKVAVGEADAGIVYRSDVATSGGAVTGIDVADAVVVAYPAAVLTEAARPDLARAFIAHLGSATARAALVAAGFTVPR